MNEMTKLLNPRSIFKLATVIIVLWLPACGGEATEEPSPTSPPADTSTPTEDLEATAEYLAPTETRQAQDTETAGTATAFMQVFNDDRATTMAGNTATAQAEADQISATGTAQVQSMLDQVEWLYEGNFLRTMEGSFYNLSDFSGTWDQIGWYRRTPTGNSPANFVLRADAFWESDSTTPNSSGCTIIFRVSGSSDDHYAALLDMNGWVRFWKMVNENFSYISVDPVELPESQEATIMLVVDDVNFSYFVNDELVTTRRDLSLDSGGLAFAITSGTNAGFGTRCEVTNIQLWEIDAD